ncbi:questin oxidase family protein [Streptomyces sp. NPDC004561]
MSTTGTLYEAYERFHLTGPEFSGDEHGNNGLTNHGPMAAEALARRGFETDIPRWVDRYVDRLVEMPRARQPITDADWREALGDGRRIGDWTAYFTRCAAERPWTDVLAQWWPRLLPGIAAGATHGVIRVGHAVRTLTHTNTADGNASAASVAELAHGLAFWAARCRTIPGATAPSGLLDPAQALSQVPHLPEQNGLIAHRLGRLTDVPGWSRAQAALRAPADDDDVVRLLQHLVDAATERYLTHGHGSPVLLVHTATAPNAVLHTLPVLPRALWAPSLTAVWSASAAIISAYEPTYAIPRDELPFAPTTADPVSEAVLRSVDHGDEHVIKFTDTAAESYERTGNPDALAAAARAGDLITPSH